MDGSEGFFLERGLLGWLSRLVAPPRGMVWRCFSDKPLFIGGVGRVRVRHILRGLTER